MSRIDRHLRTLAEDVIACESRRNGHSAKNGAMQISVFERLRLPLAALVGGAGFGALLSRALALSCQEYPWLCALQAKPDGSLEGLALLEARDDSGKISEGSTAVFAHLLGLLMALIGEPLTVRLIRDVWPKLPVNGTYSGNGHEDTP